MRAHLTDRLSLEVGTTLIDESRLPGRQGRLVLAYLLLEHRRPVPRHEIADALWGGEPPSSWEKGITVVVSKIRTVLGDAGLDASRVLTHAFGCYQLQLPEGTSIDVEEAQGSIEQAEKALVDGDAALGCAGAARAAEIARRGFLPGEEGLWVEARRADLQSILCRALDCTVEASLELGDAAGAVAAATEAIGLEPYREHAYLQLMRAQALGGDRAEALRTYERCRRLLGEELGVRPSPRTEAVYLTLLGSEPALSPAEPLSLPAPLRVESRFGLVGREDELGRLDGCWSAASAGTPGLAAIAGEAGAGKTRLAAEFARWVRARGGQVLYGRCEEGLEAAYQPFCEALRHYCVEASIDQLRGHPFSQLAEVARLVPDLRDRLTELADAAPVDAGSDRYRLFDAISGVLAEASHRCPTLLILDDLQWAEAGTLLLLRHLLRHAPRHAEGTTLLIVAMSRRTTKLDNALAAVAAELARETAVEQLTLGGLAEADVLALATEAVGRDLTGDERRGARGLWTQTDGNPFLVTGVLARGASALQAFATGAQSALPEGVRAFVTSRFVALSPTARRALQAAAVVGPTVEFALLDRILDVAAGDPDALLDALDELAGAGMLVEMPGTPGRYRFRHDLIRVVVDEQLSGIRRARLHLRVGRTLEAMTIERPPEQLARHFLAALAAGGGDKAIEWLTEAGRAALSVFAYEQAADHFSRALEVLDEVAPDDWDRRGQLQFDLDQALARSGHALHST